MFNGVIKGLGLTFYVKKYKFYYLIGLKIPKSMLYNLKTGDSISCNGCCLTIKKIINNFLYFEVIKETLKISNLSKIKINNLINIERSIKLIDDINGHILSGHVISYCKLIYKKNNIIWFKYKKKLIKYIIFKGFLGIDGISLTINFVYKNIFFLNIISQTYKKTILNYIKIWYIANLEINYNTQLLVNVINNFS